MVQVLGKQFLLVLFSLQINSYSVSKLIFIVKFSSKVEAANFL